MARSTCPEDVFEGMSPDLRAPKLPWRVQEDWGCERNRTSVRVLVLENELLRAAITPQWGGKVWSLYHKGHKRQLFFNNPAHQPANIGYLKAWAAGGAEWNWSPGHVGHSTFSESPVWTAVLPSEMGPVVRVWEYDRLNGTVWQVDILIANETMYAHPKVTNPNTFELPGYWWTCVAMPVDSPATRIIAPATLSINNDGCAPWPNGQLLGTNSTFRGIDIDGCAAADAGRGTCAWQVDSSYLGNIPTNNDFFMHIDKSQQPWIAHSKADGWTVVHSHPNKLNGTKFFEWGYDEFGTYNQDFLSASETDVAGCNADAYDPHCEHMVHEGAYTELQVGPARTQMHTFPLPAATTKDKAGAGGLSRGVYEWTEWFKATMADPSVMLHPEYAKPIAAVKDWIKSPEGMSSATLSAADELLARMADTPPTPAQIVHKGMPWGGLQQKMLARMHTLNGATAEDAAALSVLAPGCPFPEPARTDETTPWLELLESGTFSAATLKVTPVNYEVSDAWVAMLDRSIAAGHATWLHHLFLGTHALEVGNAIGGRSHMEASMKLRPTVPAARALAMLAPTAEDAAKAYERAWSLWEALESSAEPNAHQLGADLAGEIAAWLLGNKRWEELATFLGKLKGATTAAYLLKDRVLHARAALHVTRGEFDSAIPILRRNCFPTYGSMRGALIVLWHTAQEQKAVAAKGGALTLKEKLRLRKRLRCYGDASNKQLDIDACICGQPNLGYSYI